MTTTKKGIRKIVFGTLVAGSAIFVGSAFTKGEMNNLRAETEWFELKPNGIASNPHDYVKVNSEPLCNDSGYVCAIQAEMDEDGLPILSSSNPTRFRGTP